MTYCVQHNAQMQPYYLVAVVNVVLQTYNKMTSHHTCAKLLSNQGSDLLFNRCCFSVGFCQWQTNSHARSQVTGSS